ncbi:MAG: ATP-dependent protease subunit HslV [Clostridia bacterium]|nr:ATP-dependent protease subunit HslV [Clostridia bacterium]
MDGPEERRFCGTTVIGVLRDGKCAIGSDGQVTLGNTVVKHKARKIRVIGEGTVLAGFAGSVSDSLALLERFEKKLSEYKGNLTRAAAELGREWRTDRVLQKLEAMLIVANGERMLLLSGGGEVLEPDDGIAAVGSGGAYALAAARALAANTSLGASEIVRKSLEIASEICIYTNGHITVEEL